MKNSKFWIWFIPLFLIICVGIYNLMVISSKKQIIKDDVLEVSKDALTIKEDYEKLNSESIPVTISENNNYVITDKNLSEDLFSGNGILYFGESSSYASRKTLSLLSEAVNSTSINKVYFIYLSKIDEEYLNYLKEKLDVDKIDAADTYLIKDGVVINEIKVNEYDNDQELTSEHKEKLQSKYLIAINDLIEKCNESC